MVDLPAPRKPREPYHRALVTIAQMRAARGDVALVPEDIRARDLLAVRVNAPKNDAAAGDIAVVHDHKPAHDRQRVVIVEHERTAGLKGDFGDVVAGDEFTPAFAHGLKRRGVDHAIHRDDFAIDFLRGEFQLVARADLRDCSFPSRTDLP